MIYDCRTDKNCPQGEVFNADTGEKIPFVYRFDDETGEYEHYLPDSNGRMYCLPGTVTLATARGKARLLRFVPFDKPEEGINMSWHVAILPCTISGEQVSVEKSGWADWVIPEGASDAEVDRVAELANWQMPLKIFAPSQDDARLLRFLQRLDEEYSMGPDEYQVFVTGAEGKNVEVDFEPLFALRRQEAQAAAPTQENRFRVLCLSPQTILDILRGGVSGEGHVCLAHVEGIPQGAEVQAVNYDDWRNSMLFRLAHPSFEPVDPGVEIPPLRPFGGTTVYSFPKRLLDVLACAPDRFEDVIRLCQEKKSRSWLDEQPGRGFGGLATADSLKACLISLMQAVGRWMAQPLEAGLVPETGQLQKEFTEILRSLFGHPRNADGAFQSAESLSDFVLDTFSVPQEVRDEFKEYTKARADATGDILDPAGMIAPAEVPVTHEGKRVGTGKVGPNGAVMVTLDEGVDLPRFVQFVKTADPFGVSAVTLEKVDAKSLERLNGPDMDDPRKAAYETGVMPALKLKAVCEPLRAASVGFAVSMESKTKSPQSVCPFPTDPNLGTPFFTNPYDRFYPPDGQPLDHKTALRFEGEGHLRCLGEKDGLVWWQGIPASPAKVTTAELEAYYATLPHHAAEGGRALCGRAGSLAALASSVTCDKCKELLATPKEDSPPKIRTMPNELLNYTDPPPQVAVKEGFSVGTWTPGKKKPEATATMADAVPPHWKNVRMEESPAEPKEEHVVPDAPLVLHVKPGPKCNLRIPPELAVCAEVDAALFKHFEERALAESQAQIDDFKLAGEVTVEQSDKTAKTVKTFEEVREMLRQRKLGQPLDDATPTNDPPPDQPATAEPPKDRPPPRGNYF